jgi:hypothetical protein
VRVWCVRCVPCGVRVWLRSYVECGILKRASLLHRLSVRTLQTPHKVKNVNNAHNTHDTHDTTDTHTHTHTTIHTTHGTLISWLASGDSLSVSALGA